MLFSCNPTAQARSGGFNPLGGLSFLCCVPCGPGCDCHPATLPPWECRPEAAATAYWSSVPPSLLWPMVVIATLAAIIASQALITGSFSIVQQVRAACLLHNRRLAQGGRSAGVSPTAAPSACAELRGAAPRSRAHHPVPVNSDFDPLLFSSHLSRPSPCRPSPASRSGTPASTSWARQAQRMQPVVAK